MRISTRLSWSSRVAFATSFLLASASTLLIGTWMPRLLGPIEPSSRAKATAIAIEASARNVVSLSRNSILRTPWANSPRATSSGLRRLARPDCTRADPLGGWEPRGGRAALGG